MNLVFVHLGPSNSKHLWANIRYCLKTFPFTRVTVILDHLEHFKHIQDLDVELHFYKPSALENSLMDELAHDFSFRKGFWRYSIQRLFALNHWHSLHGNESFLHVESDVLLLKNFPWSKFATYNKLAWLRHNQSLDCAAILFSPSFDKTSWLCDQLVSLLKNNSGLTDMTALNQISNLYPNKVSLLPTLGSSWVHAFEERSQETALLLSQEFSHFKGVFDPAAIGVWLTGNDPRNRLGWITRYSTHFEPFLEPNKLKFLGNINREVSISLASHPIPLFNLHIHSKQTSYFGCIGSLRIYFDTLSSKKRRFKNRLVLRLTFQVIKDYLRKENNLFTPQTIANIRGFISSKNP